MVNIENYYSISINGCYSKYKWPAPNIITTSNEYNEILDFISANGCERHLTINGHLSKDEIGDGYCFVSSNSTNTFEHLVIYDGRLYRFVFWPGHEEENITGHSALIYFRKNAGELAKKYALKSNAEVAKVKETILKPYIKLVAEADKTYDEGLIIHLDLNSAYPAGIAATTPELAEFFNKEYKKKKEGDISAKALLNYGIGAMQSLKLSGYRYPELSRRAIQWTREQLEQMTEKILRIDPESEIIAYNTDGMWVKFSSKIPLLLLKEEMSFGHELGQWKVDHIVEKLRFKSAGAYEFVEQGEYHAVVRGIPKTISKDFQWGDIYLHHPRGYKITQNNMHIEEVEIDG